MRFLSTSENTFELYDWFEKLSITKLLIFAINHQGSAISDL